MPAIAPPEIDLWASHAGGSRRLTAAGGSGPASSRLRNPDGRPLTATTGAAYVAAPSPIPRVQKVELESTATN
jgi:hypothetical protein